MDAQKFLAEFGHMANAPGGIERLRELIYQFAVTGRLAPQQTEEGDASLVLERVAQIKQQLIREKRFKRTAKLESETLMAPGIALPESWCWSRLLDLGEINPRNDAEEDHAATFVPMAAVSEKHGQLLGGEVTRWGAISKGYTHFANGDVLIAKITPCFENGKAARVTGLQHGIGAGSTEFHVFRPITEDVNPAYVYLFLRSPLFRVRGQASMTGTAGQKRLTTDYFALCAMPLPPKGEQARIVAKVDELMALCDRLEKQHQDRRKLQNALRRSTLRALASAESPHELQESWTRLQAHFGSLVFEPSDVEDVVAELKNLAVRGLLATASSAPVDVERIKSDSSVLRAEYMTAGLMRRQKLVDQVENVVSYPEHWAVTAFDEVAVVIGGVTKGRNFRGRKTLVCPYLSVANVQRGYFKLTSLKSIEIAEDELTKYVVHEGDLLITEGGDWDKVGRTAIWRGGVQNCLHQNHVFKARVSSDHLLNEWVELVFNSGVGRDYFAGASKQTTNLASINMTQLRGFPLPVPPLDEQRRILKNLAELTALCNTWRDQIDKKSALSALLASSVVASLTGINVEKNEEAVKAPKTELIAPLRLGTLPDVKDLAPLAILLARNQGVMSSRDLWQRFGGEIDAFYAQLKTEVAHGWIEDPSYELGKKAPQGPRTYPEGALVAKMKIKQEA
ncbi:restriction endonuclease subunit S [Achromobacter sp. ACM04]|uniref:restriction endonuclease subunit S n=1 Tax=Achromobacter sp. ACM04 TaxID=2769312 RepID=UPI00177CBC00|nr:restriction endonuclease subunit S [Achromobacter sp. ACM04]MBD9420713.1 restriction endonuclease subunit S [Achromobacter sp. ACM04]